MKKIYVTPAVNINMVEANTIIATSLNKGSDTSDMGGKIVVDVKADNDWDFWGDSEEE